VRLPTRERQLESLCCPQRVKAGGQERDEALSGGMNCAKGSAAGALVPLMPRGVPVATTVAAFFEIFRLLRFGAEF